MNAFVTSLQHLQLWLCPFIVNSTGTQGKLKYHLHTFN